MLSTVYLAAEDRPGLAVGRRLISEHPALTVYREDNARGFGNLKRRVGNYQKMGLKGLPVLLLTDLDQDPCPGAKVLTWLGGPPCCGFLFRICVREVEAWLLADFEAISGFLKVKPSSLPQEPERLGDPKGFLISLAQKAPRSIRQGMTPTGRAKIGPEYNELLEKFIAEDWSVERAASKAPSLKRARERTAELAALVSQ